MGPAEVVLGKEPLLLCVQVIRLEGYFTLWCLVRLANGGNVRRPLLGMLLPAHDVEGCVVVFLTSSPP